MANLIIGNGEDIRALVESLFTRGSRRRRQPCPTRSGRPFAGNGKRRSGFFEVALGMGGSP